MHWTLVTDDLKAKLQPVSRRLMEIEKERRERRKIRKRSQGKSSAAPAAVEVAMDDERETEEPGGQLQEETVYRETERTELEALISPDVREDAGASQTGLYELIAIIAHKGAAADAGHYIGFVKKSVFHTREGEQEWSDDDDEDWYKFDDDKVSVFPVEKLTTLDGGGEDASAYVLLYKSKSIA